MIFPIFSTSHSTISPSFRNSGGVLANPTPLGVPVAIISPGTKYVLLDIVSICVGISNIWCFVFDSCFITPFILQKISRL